MNYSTVAVWFIQKHRMCMILSKDKKQPTENQTVGNLSACVFPFKKSFVINSLVNGQYMKGFHVS